MARSERVPVERVRVRTRIVSEVRQVEVEVRREELVVTREPVAADAAPQADHDEAGDVVLVLHEEVPVVSLETRPVERVVVRTQRVESTRQVEVDLDREVVDVDTDVG